MIVCPNCNHQNPESSTQCENCYTPLPQTTSCPNCGASVQTDATFCGQCGFNLQAENLNFASELSDTFVEPSETFVASSAKATSYTPISPWDDEEIETISSSESWQTNETEVMQPTSEFGNLWEAEDLETEEIGELEEIPDLSSPLSEFEAKIEEIPDLSSPLSEFEAKIEETPDLSSPLSEFEANIEETPDLSLPLSEFESNIEETPDLDHKVNQPKPPEPPEAAVEEKLPPSRPPFPVGGKVSSATQLQIQQASLLHVQTNANLELPSGLFVIHIGKPNSQIPPDIDVSGFPNSEVVSRIHADIRVEGDTYYLEDVGSSNGTYVNHTPLPPGNRHRLRPGDRISLGKGDLVSFIFQLH